MPPQSAKFIELSPYY